MSLFSANPSQPIFPLIVALSNLPHLLPPLFLVDHGTMIFFPLGIGGVKAKN